MRLVSLLALLVSPLLAACQSQPPADITDPGQLIFLGYAKKEVNCSRCHGAEGQGGTDAPEIRGVSDKYDENTILGIIELGKGEGEDAMPGFEGQLTESEIRALLKFLTTLKPLPSETESSTN